MFNQELKRFEAQFYRDMNRFVEPLVRTGYGSPDLLWPTSMIVVETKGQKTGLTLNIPLLANRIGRYLLISTVRRESQWIKNLAAHPEVHYWIAGQRNEATAVVFPPDAATSPSQLLSPALEWVVTALRPYSRVWGGGAALLIPQRSPEQETSNNL